MVSAEYRYKSDLVDKVRGAAKYAIRDRLNAAGELLSGMEASIPDMNGKNIVWYIVDCGKFPIQGADLRISVTQAVRQIWFGKIRYYPPKTFSESIIGPFFSRQSAQKYLKNGHHKFTSFASVAAFRCVGDDFYNFKKTVQAMRGIIKHLTKGYAPKTTSFRKERKI